MLPDAEVIIAHNENDAGAKAINGMLAAAGLTTFFAPRDELHPSTFAFEQMLRKARTVVVLIGSSGLAATQKMYVESGRKLGLRFVPAIIGNPTKAGLNEMRTLFESRSIHDLRNATSAVMKTFCDDVAGKPQAVPGADASAEPPAPGEDKALAYHMAALTEGSERDRSGAIAFIRAASDGARARFGERLRREITTAYLPLPKTADDSPNAERKARAATRAWLFSALMLSAPNHADTLALAESSMNEKAEPYEEVRFRILSCAYQASARNIGALILKGVGDRSPLVSVLARAIANPDDPAFAPDFDKLWSRSGFEARLPYLRAMRVVAIPSLAVKVAALFTYVRPDPSQAASIFYALRHPQCALLAAPQLLQAPGIEPLLELMLRASLEGAVASADDFAELVRAFNRAQSVPVLSRLRDSRPEYRVAAIHLLRILEGKPGEPEQVAPDETMQVAGYRADTIATQADRLGIAREVNVFTTLMLSKDVMPPLAIGLFGNWGSGKSFFMHAIHKRAETIALNAATNDSKRFCATVVQIEFNAWHYADTSLWASLVTCILEKLRGHFTPAETFPKAHADASEEVASKKEEVERARVAEEKASIELERDMALKAELETKRNVGDIPLSAFSIDDLKGLVEKNPALKLTVQQALDSLAVPRSLKDVHSLSAALREAQSTFGRATALISALCRPRILGLFIAILMVVVLGVPALVEWLHATTQLDYALTSLGARIAQFGAAAAAIATWMRQALRWFNEGLDKVDKARSGIEKIVKAKKAELKSGEEKEVEARIVKLQQDLQARQEDVKLVESGLKEAQAKLDGIAQQASLEHFLSKRLLTDDYSKHQGLVATVRDDFDRLTMLINEQSLHDNGVRPIERVILYIDDLDRCAAPKVVEVLQAVHLLLAYPLFVVVVGVDARWLMHSLTTHYRQLGGDSNGVDAEWAAKPQHYLEKIFQITYALRPMNEEGFGDLIEELMGGSAEAPQAKQSDMGDERDISVPQSAFALASSGEDSPSARSGPELAAGPMGETPSADFLDETPPGAADSRGTPPDDALFDVGLPDTAPQAPQPAPELSTWSEEESMALQRVEAKFARKLHRFIPSPRAAKRLSNIYRILKAGIPRYRLAEFEGDEAMPGQFRVPMLLLAILIYDSEAADLIFRSLQLAPENLDTIVTLRSVGKENPDAALSKLVQLAIRTCEEEGLESEQKLFRRWIPEVSRFSFGMTCTH